MKILILNGSPREGNCVAAVNALTEGISDSHDVEVIKAHDLSIDPCMACELCECQFGCVCEDDTNMITEKMINADMIVFTSPVYWWGITAQLKLVIDKAYSRAVYLKDKKVGVIVVGGAAVGSEQYDLIRRQFICISQYLDWDILFHRDYSASLKDDLLKDTAALSELKAEGERL